MADVRRRTKTRGQPENRRNYKKSAHRRSKLLTKRGRKEARVTFRLTQKILFTKNPSPTANLVRNVQGHIGAESSEAKCQLAAKTDQKKANVIKFERKEIQLSREVPTTKQGSGSNSPK